MRVALVTGSGRGIGRAIAVHLARDGAAVAVHDRTGRGDVAEVVAEITAAGGVAAGFGADLGVANECDRLAAEVTATLGPIDILVNNAGMNFTAEIEDADLDGAALMRDVNLDAPVRLARIVVGGMKGRGWGRIVNISSLAGLGTATRGATFYAMSKAALIMFTKRLALDAGPHGVTVNAVAPGVIATQISRDAGVDFDAIAAGLMVRRVGEPEDIAAAVSFFAGEESGFVTAQVLAVDGGATHYLSPT